MFRHVIAASTVLLGLGVGPLAPQAAADADQVVSVVGGQVQCLLSSNFEDRGAMAICAMANGAPFGASPDSTGKFPVKLNRVVVVGSGQHYWDAGPFPGSTTGATVVGDGQTYAVNGWTVVNGPGLRATVKNDVSDHGVLLSPVNIRGV